MLSIKSVLLGFVTLCLSLKLHSQTSVRENDYTLNYTGNTIELVYDVPVFVKAYDVTSKEELIVTIDEKKLNTFVLTDLLPSQIVKVEYRYLYGKNYDVQTSYIANQSSSTGAINVYFNHPVDTNFAQTQNAVNLGNTLDDMLISYIDSCVSTLDIAIYNSYSPSGTVGIAGAINAAYNRGVQVRVIYDGSTSSVMIPLLNSNIPTLASPVSSFYGIMHNKFVLFDANSGNADLPYVWTGSTNWTTAQIDGPDKNSAIVIQDQALALGYKIEFEEMWGSTTMTPNASLSKFGPDKTDNTPHTYVIGGKIVNSYFSPSDNVNSKIIATINSANSDIDIATMLITRNDLSTALISKYNGGLSEVNIVLDSQNPSGNQLSNLQSGINASQVVTYAAGGIMHHKFMVIDNFDTASDPQVLLGSHNWSNSAENRNDENTLIVHDANITNQYYQAFAYLYQQAGGILSTNENEITNENVIVYPNPTAGILYINAKEIGINDRVLVRVYDMLGSKVVEKQYSHLTNDTIDLSSQSSGLYFVDVTTSGRDIWFKVVKE